MHFLPVPIMVPLGFQFGELLMMCLLPVPSPQDIHTNVSGLVISNVDLSLNMNSYSCFFSSHIGGGQFMDIESTTGFLVIAGL